MRKFSILTLVLFTFLHACGSTVPTRALTGGGLGAGVAVATAANPLLGAALGAGLGAITNRNNIDLGEAPF